MSGPDGDAMDPAIARVLLIYREAVAQLTEQAYLDLVELGVNDPGELVDRPPSTGEGSAEAPIQEAEAPTRIIDPIPLSRDERVAWHAIRRLRELGVLTPRDC